MAARLFGQGAEQVTAWIDMQQMDGKAIIVCWCQNHTASPLHLTYEAVLIRNDSTLRKGKTLAIPDQPNLLLNAMFTVPDGVFDKVTLRIFQGEKTLATATLPGPEPESITLPSERTDSQNTKPNALKFDEFEIDGLILDETRSKLAHDFYELFYNNWTAGEELTGSYTIVIREQPAFIGIGTRIVVEVDGQELTQLNLQPRAEVVESLAGQLVESLRNYLLNPDGNIQELETEDLTGSGIY